MTRADSQLSCRRYGDLAAALLAVAPLAIVRPTATVVSAPFGDWSATNDEEDHSQVSTTGTESAAEMVVDEPAASRRTGLPRGSDGRGTD